ncbi:hypothetical protein M3Y98_00911600 [Aphelenchoides besseyi]|nr:hypothetical protein M3Y98_00911600 [Aphelenchoides besseyi]
MLAKDSMQNRSIGAMFGKQNVKNEAVGFKAYCPNYYQMHKYVDPTTGNEFVLPYKSSNQSWTATPLDYYVVSKRGDCNCWRQIEIRIQRKPIKGQDPDNVKLPSESIILDSIDYC